MRIMHGKGIINNKEKQAAGHCWSASTWEKRHTNIPDPLIPDRPMYKGSRKYKKKVKKPWIWSPCPFCGKELRLLIKPVWSSKCRDVCECGAIKDECPCCHRNSYQKDGLFKHTGHYFLSCGFVGKRLEWNSKKR